MMHMSPTILFSDTPEHFYQKLQEIIQETIHQELVQVKKLPDEPEYIKLPEVIQLLRVSKPTVDRHVRQGYYKKHFVGSRVFFSKQEILSYLKQSSSLSTPH
jgi:excisionase family DNA binding protein